MSKLPPTSLSTTLQFWTTCVVWVRCLAVSTLPQICRCVSYETRDFLWDGKLAPPACPGTTGRHDFDIRSRKQFLETVDLAREYRVPICRLAIKLPSYAHCIRFVGFVHRYRSKMIGSCQNNVRVDREG